MQNSDFQYPPYQWKELSPATWQDFEQLFGVHGAFGGCWCMFFRGTRKAWNDNRGEGNRLRLKEIVERSAPVGLLAYSGDRPVGWCAVAPRTDYDALARSKFYKAIDNKLAWAITCFFTVKDFRRKGITRFLIKEAIGYARMNGAEVLEAFPIVPTKEKVADIYAYTGFFQVFLDLGFHPVKGLEDSHPFMRYTY